MAKHLILGNGYMGNRIFKNLKDSIMSNRRIGNIDSVDNEIKKYKPEVVLNCIAKTGRPNIDWCENNKEKTYFSNVIVPHYIAKVCSFYGKKMVHISTGYFYDGNKNGEGYSEKDEPNSINNYYNFTKFEAEKRLQNFDNVLQLRINMPSDKIPHERNLITRLLGYKKIVKSYNSITIVDDFIKILKYLIKKDSRGIFNVVNEGIISFDEILDMYSEISGISKKYELITQDELNSAVKAKRSACILSVKKLEGSGINVPNIKVSMRKCLEEYVKNEVKI
ncbi:MAG: sugar nucleotide-binding protein [Nanoarchaeota archaeon]